MNEKSKMQSIKGKARMKLAAAKNVSSESFREMENISQLGAHARNKIESAKNQTKIWINKEFVKSPSFFQAKNEYSFEDFRIRHFWRKIIEKFSPFRYEQFYKERKVSKISDKNPNKIYFSGK